MRMTQLPWLREADEEITSLLSAYRADPKAFYKNDLPSRVKGLQTAIDTLKTRLAPLPNSHN